MNPKFSARKKLLSALLIVCAVFAIFLSLDADRKTNAARVSAGELINGFLINEDSATRHYRGRLVEVSGTVAHVCEDADQESYFVLKSETIGTIYTVSCYLNESIDGLSDVQAGDAVTLRGMCNGIDRYAIRINDCVPE